MADNSPNAGKVRKTNEDHAQIIYDRAGPFAAKARVVLQMLIGVSIVGLILASVLFISCTLFTNNYCKLFTNNEFFTRIAKIGDTDHGLFESAHRKLLSAIGYGLVVSAGIDLAYMLFTPDLDEAVSPLIVALSAGSIIVLSGDGITSNWYASLALVVMVSSIVALFWVQETFLEKRKQELEKKNKRN